MTRPRCEGCKKKMVSVRLRNGKMCNGKMLCVNCYLDCRVSSAVEHRSQGQDSIEDSGSDFSVHRES